MEDLVLSCLESRVENNRNLYARFLVGPFIKGNALTVATALRRVLLSSVESVAITALYIQGITHEFSTIVGVRESVLELSLNFQSIVLSYDKNFLKQKDFFEDFQIGYLQVQGPKVVYANDLKLPLGIKVVDPTQYIATISREGVIVLKFTIGKIDNRIISKSSSHSFSPESTKQVIHHPVFGELVKKNILKTKKRYFYKSIYAVNSFKSISQHRLIRAQECALISRVGSSFLNKKKNNSLKKKGNQPLLLYKANRVRDDRVRDDRVRDELSGSSLRETKQLLSPNLQFLAYNAKYCKKKASRRKLVANAIRFVYTDIQRKIENKSHTSLVANAMVHRVTKRSFVVPHVVRQSDASESFLGKSKLVTRREGDRRKGDRREGDRREGDRREGDFSERVKTTVFPSVRGNFADFGDKSSRARMHQKRKLHFWQIKKLKESKANLYKRCIPMQSINHVDSLQNESRTKLVANAIRFGLPSKLSQSEGLPSKLSQSEGLPSKLSQSEGLPSKLSLASLKRCTSEVKRRVLYNENLANVRYFPEKFVGTRFSTFWLCKKISEYRSKINSVTNFVVMGSPSRRLKKEIFQVRCFTYHTLLSFYKNLNEQPEVTSPDTLQGSSNASHGLSVSSAVNLNRVRDDRSRDERDTIFKKGRTSRNFFIKFRSRLVRGFHFYQVFSFSKERSKSTIDSYNSLIYKPLDNSFCFYKILARKSFFPFRGILPEYALHYQKLPITRKFTNIQSTNNLAGRSLDRSRALPNASSQAPTSLMQRFNDTSKNSITYGDASFAGASRTELMPYLHPGRDASARQGNPICFGLPRFARVCYANPRFARGCNANPRFARVCVANHSKLSRSVAAPTVMQVTRCKREILLDLPRRCIASAMQEKVFLADASPKRCISNKNPTEVIQEIHERSKKIRTKQKRLIFLKRSTNFVKKEVRREEKVFKSDICLRNIIPLDFTLPPVLKVNFVIEIDDEVLYLRQKIRERIILEIWTNGSIHPRQAVHDATLSLLDMFSSFRSLYQTSDYSSPLLQLPSYS